MTTGGIKNKRFSTETILTDSKKEHLELLKETKEATGNREL